MSDSVNHPSHYNEHPSGVECIEIAEHLSFCLGNAFKYVFRAGKKGNRIEDLKKALWYVDRESLIDGDIAAETDAVFFRERLILLTDKEPDLLKCEALSCIAHANHSHREDNLRRAKKAIQGLIIQQ